jgi:hypothetical protein
MSELPCPHDEVILFEWKRTETTHMPCRFVRLDHSGIVPLNLLLKQDLQGINQQSAVLVALMYT